METNHRKWVMGMWLDRCLEIVRAVSSEAPALRMAPATVVAVGGHKMHIFTVNKPTFHSRYRR
jgi:hypothetical protein